MSGRLRWYRHVLIAGLGAFAAWAWFGWSGLLLVLVWAWHRSPRRGQVLHLVIGTVTWSQLGALRTVAWGRWGERIEVFHDELPPAALASLRRHLKSICSAGDGT